jgi:ABC-type branched-subunit amino acid transport system permease subunit
MRYAHRPGRKPPYAWVLLAALALGPLLLSSDYLQFVAVMILINSIAAMGVNLSMGYCGLVSVGHAGFLCIGAYVAAFVVNHVSRDASLAIVAGGGVAGVAGVFISVPTLRLNPLYIAMVTFGFGQATNLVAVNWIGVTGGPNGLAVDGPTLFGVELDNTMLYLAAASVFLLFLWISYCSSRSRLGRAFLAVKESEIAAKSMGIPVARYKIIAFAMSAAMGGAAGSLYALVSGYVNPDAFVFQVSIMLVTMCLVGGLGRLSGPIVGAVIFTVVPEVLRPFAEYREFFSGVVLLGFLLLMPRGLATLADRFGLGQAVAEKPT